MKNFIKVNYSIDQLEQFRDNNGFIDLTQVIKITPDSIEESGNPNRIKNWVDFNGTKVLIKGSCILENTLNYGFYAELIVEEIFNKLNVSSAHYDLVKLNNLDGKKIYGVLSFSVVSLTKEYLLSLHDIIGDDNSNDDDFIDSTNYYFTITKLEESLKKSGYDDFDIEKVIMDYKKMLLLTLVLVDADNHTENFAFIKRKVEGKDQIKLSPKYDNESSLMLDNDLLTIKHLLTNYNGLKSAVDITQPKIGVFKKIEDGGLESYWKDTLEALCEDDEIFDYYNDCIRNKIDMDEILSNVEKRIKSNLPESAKLIAKYSYVCRSELVNLIMDGEYEPKRKEKI